MGDVRWRDHPGMNRRQTEELRIVDGIRLLQSTPADLDDPTIVPAPDDRACPDCGGRRCWDWRDSGHVRGCGNRNRPANSYLMVLDAVANPGRHQPEVVLARWLAGVRWRNPIALRVRVGMAPNAWALRLGRAVQIGHRPAMALP